MPITSGSALADLHETPATQLADLRSAVPPEDLHEVGQEKKLK